jgi:hypothetical protein
MSSRRTGQTPSPPRPRGVTFSHHQFTDAVEDALQSGLRRGGTHEFTERRYTFHRYHDRFGPEVRRRLPPVITTAQVDAKIARARLQATIAAEGAVSSAKRSLREAYGVGQGTLDRMGAAAMEDFREAYLPALETQVETRAWQGGGDLSQADTSAVKSWVKNQVELNLANAFEAAQARASEQAR